MSRGDNKRRRLYSAYLVDVLDATSVIGSQRGSPAIGQVAEVFGHVGHGLLVFDVGPAVLNAR